MISNTYRYVYIGVLFINIYQQKYLQDFVLNKIKKKKLTVLTIWFSICTKIKYKRIFEFRFELIVLSMPGLYRCGEEFFWVHWSYICWEDNNTVTTARGICLNYY